MAHLAVMVAWIRESPGQISYLTPAEILEEFRGHDYFPSSLSIRFGRYSLYQFREVILNFLLIEHFRHSPVDIAIHQVSLGILEGVVHSVFGAFV